MLCISLMSQVGIGTDRISQSISLEVNICLIFHLAASRQKFIKFYRENSRRVFIEA